MLKLATLSLVNFRRLLHSLQINLPSLPSNTRYLLYQTSTGLLLSHDFHSLLRDSHQSKEVHLHLCPNMLVFQLFKRPRQPVAGIVDDHIDALEFLKGLGEGGFNVCGGGHVQFEGKVVIGGGVAEGECGGIVGGCWRLG